MSPPGESDAWVGEAVLCYRIQEEERERALHGAGFLLREWQGDAAGRAGSFPGQCLPE